MRARHETGRLDGHTNLVTSVAFAPDGKHLVSGSDDKTVRLWNIESGDQIAVLRGHSAWVSSVAFSPDGNHIASGSWDKTIRVWDISIILAVRLGLPPNTGLGPVVGVPHFLISEDDETESDSEATESFRTAACTPTTDFE
jgi:WD40 repeat protein